MAVGDRQIDPEDLDNFAKRMDQLAEDLADKDRPVSKLIKSNPNHGGVIDFPCAGVFASGQTFTDTYVSKINEMAGGFRQLESLLHALGDATRSVAKRYRTTEEYNQATSKEIESLIGGATPADGSQKPGDTGDNGNPPADPPRPE